MIGHIGKARCVSVAGWRFEAVPLAFEELCEAFEDDLRAALSGADVARLRYHATRTSSSASWPATGKPVTRTSACITRAIRLNVTRSNGSPNTSFRTSAGRRDLTTQALGTLDRDDLGVEAVARECGWGQTEPL